MRLVRTPHDSGRDQLRRTGVRHLTALRRASFAAALTAASIALPVGGRSSSAGTRVSDQLPNIVVIYTDDQRSGTLRYMPAVESQLVQHGVRFSKGFVVNPLCCPSRSSLLTGLYSHSTGVYDNAGTYGGFDAFTPNDGSTIATWLDAAGYRTALVGKYLNGYDDATYIPPGWDDWVAFVGVPNGGKYYDYDLAVHNATGDSIEHHGTDPVLDYSTDVLADRAETFIRGVDPSEPLFLLFTPTAPHAPAIPPPRYENAFDDLPAFTSPSVNERDVRDKPPYIRRTHRLTASDLERIQEFRRDQLRTLLAVDDAVARIIRALRDTGRFETTMIVFASDNGYLWGEHRRTAKIVPYEESISIPFVVRYDPLTGGVRRTDGAHAVLNIDIAPMLAELAGITPGRTPEGRSLLPLLLGEGVQWRNRFLVEHHLLDATPNGVPTYCAARGSRWKYVRYSGGFEELYDLDSDPYELDNVAAHAPPALDRMRAAAVALCDPPPPGFTWLDP